MSNYILTSDGELYHYGVPGMKWGKRKARGHAGPGAKDKARLEKRIAKNEAKLAAKDNRFSNKAVTKGANIIAGMAKGAGIGAGIGGVVGAGRTLFDGGEITLANILLTPLGAVKGSFGGAVVGTGAGAVAGMFKKNEG